MGKIVSEAGEVGFEFKSLKRDAQDLVIIATMGVWESKVYLSPGETMRFFAAALSSPAVLLFIISLPIIYLKKRLGSWKRS